MMRRDNNVLGTVVFSLSGLVRPTMKPCSPPPPLTVERFVLPHDWRAILNSGSFLAPCCVCVRAAYLSVLHLSSLHIPLPCLLCFFRVFPTLRIHRTPTRISERNPPASEDRLFPPRPSRVSKDVIIVVTRLPNSVIRTLPLFNTDLRFLSLRLRPVDIPPWRQSSFNSRRCAIRPLLLLLSLPR